MSEYLFETTMDKLQELWEEKQGLFTQTYVREKGMRSSQIAALVYALIELGIINHNNVEDIKK